VQASTQASRQVHKQRCRQKASAGKQQANMQAANMFMVQLDVRMLPSWNIKGYSIQKSLPEWITAMAIHLRNPTRAILGVCVILEHEAFKNCLLKSS